MNCELSKLLEHVQYLNKITDNPYWVSEYSNFEKDIIYNSNWSYQLGLTSIIKKIKKFICLVENSKIRELVQKVSVQVCSRHYVHVIQSLKFNPSINDFIIEMSREMCYCQVTNIAYKPTKIYSRLMSTLSESALIGQKCLKCGGLLVSSRKQCQDLKCSQCQSQIEVKFIGNKNKEHVTIKSGLPEGVTCWKNNGGKLVVLKDNGYFIVDSSKVSVTNYIHDLDINWEQSPNIDTKRKSNMSFLLSELEYFPVSLDFKWSSYIDKVTIFLDKLYANYFNCYYHKVKYKNSHYREVKKAFLNFELMLTNNHTKTLKKKNNS